MSVKSKIARSVKKTLTFNSDAPDAASVVVQKLFTPIDALCRWLAKRYDYFKTQRFVHKVESTDFDDGANRDADDENATQDHREHFIPVRLKVALDQALADSLESMRDCGESREQIKNKLSDFATMSEARFQFDALEETRKLRDSFAPFDPDSDSQFELEFTQSERDDKRKEFFEEIDALLVKCNYRRLSQDGLQRILQLMRPGRLPVKANFSEFEEYRIYLRGLCQTPEEQFPRWQTLGRDIRISSQRVSRICVVAYSKPSDGDAKESITVKLFKDLALEQLNIVSPRVELRFPILDGVKIGLTSGIGIVTTIVKIIVAAFSLVAFFILAFGFIFAFIKSALGFVHRRTAYMQRYARRLYYHTLASNLAAIESLVEAADEQEIKEFALGYLFALRRGGWSTEKEIDDDVEAWIKERFGLDVDFESDDALRKLKEKDMLETRIDVEADGKEVVRYRVKNLDEALRKLDEDWDNFFRYNNEA